MMGWAILLVSYAAAQIEQTGQLSNSLAISNALQLIYIFNFFVWECGYFYSIDISKSV